MNCCEQLFDDFQFVDLRTANPPKQKGVYVIRIKCTANTHVRKWLYFYANDTSSTDPSQAQDKGVQVYVTEEIPQTEGSTESNP